jgi:alkylation response protein AidB-like acyl-CoA dehydrogenase
VKRPVESAAQADHFLVTGFTGDGLSQVLVPAGAPGVSVTPLHSIDLTRRFATVTFDDVRVPRTALVGEPGDAGPQVERQLLLACVVLCAETVGTMQRGFDMTVEWGFERYSFGRPLASYQALKHRFADMRLWAESCQAITDAAADAADVPDALHLARVANAYVGDHAPAIIQDCIQLHGSIGVTWEHDLHLFLRRATVDRVLLGSPAQHRAEVGRSLLAGAGAPDA